MMVALHRALELSSSKGSLGAKFLSFILTYQRHDPNEPGLLFLKLGSTRNKAMAVGTDIPIERSFPAVG